MESKGKLKNWSESLTLLQYMKTNPKKERIKQQFNGSMEKKKKSSTYPSLYKFDFEYLHSSKSKEIWLK